MAESEFTLLRRFSVYSDAEAFAQIINQHTPMVYGACLRILNNKEKAADVVQDTFFRLAHDASVITESLPNWLHRVATCRAIDLIRSESQLKQRESRYTANFQNIDSVEKKAEWKEISIFIDEELDRLDNLTREVIILHFFEGQTMTDIAEKFGVSQPTVSRRIESGIDSLRDKLKSRGVILTAAMLSVILTENIVQAVPVSIVRELGKIAITGNKAVIGAKIASSISAGIAVKTKIMVGLLIVLLGAGLTVASSFIANGQDKPVSSYELISKSLKKESNSDPNTNITLSELLDKYAQALDLTSSFIADYEKTSEGSFRGGGQSGEGKYSSRGQLRYDKHRLFENEYRWGNWGSMTFTEDKPHYTISVVNSEINYQNTKRIGDKERPGTVIRQPRPQGLKITLHAHFGISYLAGYIGSDERLDAILRKADSIEVQKNLEKVGNSKCFVIKADTKFGRYKVWLDPEHGFHPAKLLHEAAEGDYSNRNLMAKKESATEYLQNVRFEKIGDVWVSIEADSGIDLRGAQGDYAKDTYHYKLINVVLNPDHDKLGSFDDPLANPKNDPELINGTPVEIAGFKRFTWQDGKLLDENGKVFDIDNIKPVSLLGKALPHFSEVRLNPEAIKNKKLLICFWDKDQRSSRNTILSLNKRAEALLEKDLYMIFIHAGEVEERTFTSWLKSNEIIPPVGVSITSLPELGYSWGVQSLPWLILTDTKHKVTAEGFSINDLDEKLKL